MSQIVKMCFAIIFIISCQVTSVFLTKFDGVDVKLEEGKTFINLDKFVQGILTGANYDGSVSQMVDKSCEPQCEDHIINNKSELVNQAKCNGTVKNCLSLKSTRCDDGIILYFNKTTAKLTGIYVNETIYGSKLDNNLTKHLPEDYCHDKNQYIRRTYRFCMCDCFDDNKQSNYTRSFSLLPETSDITANMIVTGLRFVQNDKRIHIQIAQSKLGATNYIEKQNKISWKPLEMITNANDTNQLMRLYSDQRKVYLDDISLPQNYVLTGVRFKNYSDTGKGALGIEIQGTEADWKSGKLKENKSRWFDSNYMVQNNIKPYGSDKKRIEIPLKDLEDSLLAPENHEISETNRFIEFTTTGRKFDLGNSTIPYFFVENITVNKPLIGAGLTYKEAAGYGGFIALKTTSHDEVIVSNWVMYTVIAASILLLVAICSFLIYACVNSNSCMYLRYCNCNLFYSVPRREYLISE